MRLRDKVVIVTGGSQGMGEAIARRFAAEGARVAVVASSSQAKAASVASSIEAAGGVARPYECDVRDPAATSMLIHQVQADFGRVDILLNAAGVFYATAAGQTSPADLDRMVDINFKGSWNTINAVVPLMQAQRGGKVINIASSAGLIGVGGYAVYCGTKAAIIMMTRALARELAPHGIQVNCLAPGNTATPMNAEIRSAPAHKAMVEALAAMTPSGRTFSPPQDMAQIALFLASDDSRAMHGSCVLADEGMTAGL